MPVPDGLAALLGYGGAARFVGMFWSDEANEVVLTDGRNRKTGNSLRFLEYFGHQAVESELGDLNIGLFNQPATIWLVLDTKAHNMYYASANGTHEFLSNQHSPGPEHACELEITAETHAVVDQIDSALDELRAYLDAFLETWERE